MKYFFLYILIISSCLTSFAFTGISNNPNITSFNRSDYGAGNKNWSISEDDMGIIYVGNDLGLLDFDGVKWELYKTPGNQVIRAVFAAPQNRVFTGGFEDFGVWSRDLTGRLSYKSLSSDLPKGSLHNDDIWRICEKDGSIYFQSFNAIFVYDGEKVRQLPTTGNMIFLNKVYNELWIQEVNGSIFKINGDVLERVPGSEMFSATEVKSILPTQDGTYLILTNSMGIYIYDGNSFSAWNTTPEIVKSNINCGIQIKSGNYLIGSILSGIFELSPQGDIVNVFNIDNYLNNNSVLTLYEDSSSHIWAGFDRGLSNIAYIEGMSSFTDPLGKIGSVYTAAIYSNKLFVGTNQGVYYISMEDFGNMNPIQNFKFIPHTEGQIWSLSVIDDKLYCANNTGVCIINENLSVSYPFRIDTGVFTIKAEAEDYLLLGTYTGLMVVNKNTKELTKIKNLTEPINRLEIDHVGNIWLQHMNKGVYRGRYINATDIPILEYIGAEDEMPYDLQIFRIGGRVAFLGDNMFYTYDDITGKIVDEHVLNKTFSGISNLHTVINITPSNFWIVGEHLVYNVTYKDQEANITSIIDLDYENLSLVDNYQNIVSLNDSTSLLCLDRGFLICSNHLTHSLNKILEPYIRSVKISNSANDNIYLTDTPSPIENSYNTITFQFASQSAYSNDVIFQYQLLGLSDEWKNIDKKENSITFERLGSGEYTFQMRRVDLFGTVSPIISYKFEILPTVYQSYLAFVLYFILIVMLIIFVAKYRLYLYKKKQVKKRHISESKRINTLNEQLQQEVEEKNAELLTQTSFIIQRNEIITNLKKDIEDFFKIQNNKALQPLYLKIKATINRDFDADEDWRMFLFQFEQKHPDFFRKLKDAYPQLTSNDLKLCACLKLNLDSKEIASLMNISVRTIENNRSRLRKKIDIPLNLQLNAFFINF